ncbi:ACT domain-containing protein, partial [Candidatus Gracilibacteria bacterium]|nr:ACT domain-containing protein [Candidatus Gracilibacteria bacterium]
HEIKNPKQIMTSITSKKSVTIVNIASFRMLMQYGFLAKVFDVFAKYETSIDVVSTSEVSVSVTVENAQHLKEIIAELKPIAKISVHSKKAIVCLVGMGIYKRRGVAGEVFVTLGRAGISIDQISQGASEINITFVLDEKDADKAVAILHKKFFENGKAGE